MIGSRTNSILSSWLKYVILPDLAQEQLLGNVFETLSFSKGRLRFVCNLTVNDLMDPSWIKVYHLMESVYPRRVQCFARVILTAYTDSRCHVLIQLSLNYSEALLFLQSCNRMPINVMQVNFQKYSDKYFVFPGAPSMLRFPFFTRRLILDSNDLDLSKSNFFLLLPGKKQLSMML